MKKKLIFISLIFALLLTGCGTATPKQDSVAIAPTTERITEPATNAPTTEEPITEAPTTVEPTTEKVIENKPVDISTLHGILVYSQDQISGKTYNFAGTNVKLCTDFTVSIDLIDEDGNVTNVRKFTNEKTKSCNLADLGGFSVQRLYQKFNSDLTKLVAKKELDNGEMHVGWIDLNGKFTDVSALVTEINDFSPLTIHETTGFGPDNYFYFADCSEDGADKYSPNRVMKRVPIDNLVPEAVEVVLDKYSYNNAYIAPDGSIDFSYQYFDATLSCPVSTIYSYDWLDVDTAVYAYTAHPQNPVVISTYDGTKNLRNVIDEIVIVDEVSGRLNTTPVFSPDKSRVAFLSGLTTEKGGTSSLYYVSVEGGTPTKINTNFLFGTPNNNRIFLMDWI